MSVLTNKLAQLQTAPKNATVHLSVKFTGSMADTWNDLSKELLCDLNASDILKEAVRVRTFIALAEREGAEITVKLPGDDQAHSLPALLRLHRSGHGAIRPEKAFFVRPAEVAQTGSEASSKGNKMSVNRHRKGGDKRGRARSREAA